MKSRIGWLLLALCVATPVDALVITHNTGKWPKSWPPVLEPLRKSAKTYDVATGTQEMVYEIRFPDRATFDKAWPAILKVVSPEAKLTLRAAQVPAKKGGLFNNAGPVVRIRTHTGGVAIDPKLGPIKRLDPKWFKTGKALKAAPPWPNDVLDKNGRLPEWVVSSQKNGKLVWVAGSLKSGRVGFFQRCRIDLEVVVDGNVIVDGKFRIPKKFEIKDLRKKKP